MIAVDGFMHPPPLPTYCFDSNVVPEMSAVFGVTQEEGEVRVFLLKMEGVFEWNYTRFLGPFSPP